MGFLSIGFKHLNVRVFFSISISKISIGYEHETHPYESSISNF